jgi:histidine ammonia-lyase
MTLAIDGRADLTLDGFRRVAWSGERVVLTPGTCDTIAAVRAAFLRFAAKQEGAIYGVTSGYGANARRRMDEAEARRFHARALAVGAMSFGDPLPDRVVRGILFSRLANLVEGHGATSVRVVQAIVEMLNGLRPVPPVPGDGNGCAGEILPLYHLFAPLSDAFEMEIKEKGPLTNGAPCAAALLADATLAAGRRLGLAVELFALSVEAFRAPLGAYDPALADLWNDPDAAWALRRLQALLAGGGGQRRSFQAPVSFRILPRVFARSHRAVTRAEATAEAILPAVTDNPIYLPPDATHPDGRSFSTGGYHDSHAVPALDALAHEWADLCLLTERHASKTLDHTSSGLPEKLSRNLDQVAGGAVALTYAPMASVGFIESARQAATTTLLPGAEGGAWGQDDVVSPVFQAWHKQEAAGRALERALAVMAAVSSQALWVTDRPAQPALAARLEQVRASVPPVDDLAPRNLGHDCGRLAEAFRAEVYGGGKG